MKTTSDILIESLTKWGIKVIFGIPGDGINGVIEAIRKNSDIEFILTRHEQAAAFMACAYSKYTGSIGACLATTGPGATNLITGLYDAKADNTPVLAITGSTYSDLIGSSYQQDVNVLELFSDVSEYNNRINKPEHAKMVADIACRTAISRKGVSHISIPIDVQYEKIKNIYSPHKIQNHTSHHKPSLSSPSENSINNTADVLNSGKKTVILVGQGAFHAREEVNELAQRLKAPVVKSLLGKAVLPDDSEFSLGGLGMLMGDFSTAIKYKLPIKVFVIKNSLLVMIRWEQISFSGNPEHAVEFAPIDYAKFAESCGGNGFTIKKYDQMKKTIKKALNSTGPVIVDVYVDPYEPSIPPDVDMKYLKNMAKSFAKGQPHAADIVKTLLNNTITEKIQGRI